MRTALKVVVDGVILKADLGVWVHAILNTLGPTQRKKVFAQVRSYLLIHGYPDLGDRE